HDDGRGRHLIAAAPVADANASGEIDLPITSEADARCPGRSVERDEPRVDRSEEDAATTAAVDTSVRVEPRGNAARRDDRETLRAIDVRVEAPALHPRLGVEGEEEVVWGEENRRVVPHQRGRLEGDESPGTHAADLAGPIRPRDAQTRHVPAIDLGERRVSRAAAVVAVARPFARRDGVTAQRG